jgi:hypothetical protein
MPVLDAQNLKQSFSSESLGEQSVTRHRFLDDKLQICELLLQKWSLQSRNNLYVPIKGCAMPLRKRAEEGNVGSVTTDLANLAG